MLLESESLHQNVSNCKSITYQAELKQLLQKERKTNYKVSFVSVQTISKTAGIIHRFVSNSDNCQMYVESSDKAIVS